MSDNPEEHIYVAVPRGDSKSLTRLGYYFSQICTKGEKRMKKYRLSKARRMELEWFCRQYNEFANKYSAIDLMPKNELKDIHVQEEKGKPVEAAVEQLSYYSERMALIEKAAMAASNAHSKYILAWVTMETRPSNYDNFQSWAHGPFLSKDEFYDLLDRFYYILSYMRK